MCRHSVHEPYTCVSILETYKITRRWKIEVEIWQKKPNDKDDEKDEEPAGEEDEVREEEGDEEEREEEDRNDIDEKQEVQ